MQITVNGEPREIESEPDTPLLWVLRDELGLSGTKYGCGIAACGACTVHVDGEAVRSCVLPLERVTGEVTTIEGLAGDGAIGAGAVGEGGSTGGASPDSTTHAVQRAWIEHQVAQCGYCQPGQVMTAAALLAADPRPSDASIDRAFAGNLCRCGTYPRIRAAVHAAAETLASGTSSALEAPARSAPDAGSSARASSDGGRG